MFLEVCLVKCGPEVFLSQKLMILLIVVGHLSCEQHDYKQISRMWKPCLSQGNIGHYVIPSQTRLLQGGEVWEMGDSWKTVKLKGW